MSAHCQVPAVDAHGPHAPLTAALIVGSLIGAAVGYLIGDSAILADQGWLGPMLASGAISLLVLLLVDWGIAWHATGLRGRLHAAWGPVLGAVLGGIAWLCRSQAGIGIPAGTWESLHSQAGWISYAVIGSSAGLLLPVFMESNNPLALGAAMGLVLGAAWGGFGEWSGHLWSVSALTGMFFVLPAARALQLGGLVRSGLIDSWDLLGTILVWAVVGSLFCGLTLLISPRLPSLEQAVWLRDLIAFFLAVPNDIAHALALPSGWLGGACAGAILSLFCSTRLVECGDSPAFLMPLAGIAGGLAGLFDQFTGGAIFDGLFGTWAAGAVTGSLVFAVVMARMTRNRKRKTALTAMLACILGAMLIGAGLGLLAVWLGAADVMAALSGGVAGTVAAVVAVKTHTPANAQAPDRRRFKPALLVLLGLLSVGLFTLFRAEKAFCHLAAGEVYRFSSDRRAVVEMTLAARWNPHLDHPFETREKCNRRLNRYHQSIQDLALLIERNPRSGEWYLRRGCAHQGLGNYKAAVRDFTQAIILGANRAEALLQRGQAYYGMECYDLAIEDFSASLALDARKGIAYLGRGASYRKSGQIQNALRDFSQAIELDPQDAQARAGRGWIHLRLDYPERALGDFNTAIEIDPTSVDAYVGRGDAYYEACGYREAIQDYDEAIRLDPCLSGSFTRRGNAYRKLGDEARAEADYAIAAALAKTAEDRE